MLLYVELDSQHNFLWKRIEFMFENKNAVNRVFIFRKIVRLRY